MNALKPTLLSAICAAALTLPCFVHHRAAAVLGEKEELFQKQSVRATRLAADNEQLSNTVAEANSRALPEATLSELLKLRNEVTQLRRVPEELESARREIGRLQDRMQDAAAEESYGPQRATALLVEEQQIRQARVARLKRWLKAMPQEWIPELQFVSEDRWLERVDRPLITDDDYRSVIGLLRADGEQKFTPMLFKALKAYAQANNNRFPADVRQLKPFFDRPVDDALLQRYEIVPAKSLVPFLAQTGGDWLITQKAPVDPSDERMAVGLTSYRATVEKGRWDR